MIVQTELEEALMLLQEAAWNRSWSKLKKARQRIKEVTGIELHGRLRAMMEEQRENN